MYRLLHPPMGGESIKIKNNNMKKLILLKIFVLIICTNITAQVNLTLAFNSRPEPFVSNWSNAINGKALITVTGAQSGGVTSAKIKTTITNSEGTNIGVTNVAAAMPFSLNTLPATNTFSLGDIVQLPSMNFIPTAQNLIQGSGRLKAGTYKLTVQVLNDVGAVLTEKIALLNVTGYQLPFLIAPANEAVLNSKIAASVIIFRWTRLTPVEQFLPTYRIQVFEVLNSQTPMQAYRSNAPVLNEVATRGATQFIWRPNLSMIDSSINHKFIWTVQTVDDNGMPYPTVSLNQQGRSEPAVFIISNKPPQVSGMIKVGRPDIQADK